MSKGPEFQPEKIENKFEEMYLKNLTEILTNRHAGVVNTISRAYFSNEISQVAAEMLLEEVDYVFYDVVTKPSQLVPPRSSRDCDF